ncbi:hypothetical protein BLJ79_21540 [Arthrobacter sp. UCD-GKA]|nr:hypothetical protein BLJ79_21540 [Arthrobacter sp. UCD-GKA]
MYDPETAEAHVIPMNDEVPHVEAPECVCGPAPELIERPNGDAWLITHHSLDGRERTEPDRRPR